MWRKITSSSGSRWSWSLLVSLMSILGFVVVLYSTVWGAFLIDDSYVYVRPARDLIAGNGLTIPATIPPGLPFFLSLSGIFKVDPLIALRWLDALFFALNIYLVTRIVYKITSSRIFSLLAGIFTLASISLIEIHSNAMSEALFTTLALCGLMVITLDSKKENWKAPLLSGLFFGLAAATRYIGISLLMAGGIFWLMDKKVEIPRRIRKTAVFSIVGVLPLLIWAIRNELLIGRPTSRVFAINPIPYRWWIEMVNTILLWFMPGRLLNGKEIYWLVAIVFLLVIGLAYYLWQRAKRKDITSQFGDPTLTIAFISLFITLYLLVAIVSRSFFDNRIPMDGRMLGPILYMVWIAIFWLFSRQWKVSGWLIKSGIVLFMLVVLGTNFTRSYQTVQSFHAVGRGYASARDHISETYAYLRNRPNTPIYSNAAVAIYFWTGRITYPIPSSAGVAAMQADMKKTGALLVIFDSIRVELYGSTREELTRGLVEQIRLSEATIYRAP